MNVRLIIIQFVLIACTSCSSDKTLIKGCGIPIVLNEIKTSLVDTAFFQASSIIPLESNDNFSLIRSIDRICVIDDTFYMLAHWVKFLCIVLQESIWDKLMI